jgi:hypothetical protein
MLKCECKKKEKPAQNLLQKNIIFLKYGRDQDNISEVKMLKGRKFDRDCIELTKKGALSKIQIYLKL